MRRSRELRVLLLGGVLTALAPGPFPAHVAAQPVGSVVGVVVEDSTLRPLEGALVSVVGSDLQAVTAADGSFTLPSLRSGKTSLRVQHPGFVDMIEEVDVAAAEISLVRFQLTSPSATLDELIAIVRRTRSNRDVEIRADAPRVSALDLLRDAPGLWVTPGTGAQVRIFVRGFTSLFLSNEAHVYVDGVLLTNNQVLHQIAAADVQRIQILSSAEAGSQYVQSSNGVIVIETRRRNSGGGPK